MIRAHWPCILAASYCLIPQAIHAQPAAGKAPLAYPVKPIRILVGPGPDVLARTLGQKLTESWGQQIVVDQRPGAGGNMAAEIASKSPADGYTLLMATSSFAANAVLQPGPFDLVKDFSAIALLATSPLILVVHPSVPAKSLQEFIALARAKPGQLNYASTGNGTAPHLAMEMLKAAAKLDVVHVPYKGAGPALVEVLAGQVQVYFQIGAGVIGSIQAGKVRALAVSSLQRAKLAPDLPTVADSGYPGFQAMGWNGLLTPVGTPRLVINQFHSEIMRSLAQPDVVQRINGMGWEPAGTTGNTPDSMGQFLKAEIAKFTKIVRENNLKVD